jgi:hypothetical protein
MSRRKWRWVASNADDVAMVFRAAKRPWKDDIGNWTNYDAYVLICIDELTASTGPELPDDKPVKVVFGKAKIIE